jgi:hypothetical protein
MKYRAGALIAVAALLIALVAGCGGDSSSSSTAAATDASSASTGSTSTDSGSTAPDANSGKPAGGFGKNELSEFGAEAEPAELEAASKVLAENLEARETKDWAGQCASLSAQVVKRVENEAPAIGAKKGCAARLEEQAPGAPAILFKDTLPGQIDVLRVEGSSAYALYHGNDGKDYAMPMKLENGEWKVDSLTTILLSSSG